MHGHSSCESQDLYMKEREWIHRILSSHTFIDWFAKKQVERTKENLYLEYGDCIS